jgi:hypothetical protein
MTPLFMSAVEIENIRRRFAAGESIDVEALEETRLSTSANHWQDLCLARDEVLRPKIVPGKSDLELAQEYRQKLLDLLEPVTVVINEARGKGLIISFGYSPPDAFGRQSLAQLDINKKLA